MSAVEELKKAVVSRIDAQRGHILALADKLLHTPELGFREFRTAGIVRDELLRIGLAPRTGLAVTGMRADLPGRAAGPAVAILGELDALPVPTHPFADPETGAAHACGHHSELAMMLAAADALKFAADRLDGTVAFIAAPAEEFQDLEFLRGLIAEGKIAFGGGKPELIRLGVFDDIDAVMMIHAGHETFVPSGYNGFCIKQIAFCGRAAHGGLSPWNGINALSMARQALNMIDAQRDTFDDRDAVRVHGIIRDGGSAVNVVPARVILELQIRAKSPEAVKRSSELVDRCVRAAALAFGGGAEIENFAGYMPYRATPELDAVHARNLRILNGGTLGNCGHRGSSTDMGDVSMLIPALHAYSCGFTGAPHTADFVVSDPDKAYIDGAKLLAMNAVDLLADGAAKAREIAAAPRAMDKKTYLEYKRQLSLKTEYHYDQN